MTIARETVRATAWGVLFTAVVGVLIVMGSRGLEHFDAALVGYTFATLFATFGITYRYAMWLQRPHRYAARNLPIYESTNLPITESLRNEPAVELLWRQRISRSLC